MEKHRDEVEKSDDQILEAMQKIKRLRQQKKFHLRKLRELGDNEVQNILELEVDEVAEASVASKQAPASASIPPEETFADSALLAMSPNAFDEFLRGLSPGVGETAAVSSGSSQGAP
ncbi:MAG: hypothetical protein LQ350_008719 [Teloschistes chrysophthalmus]|nr:MAG: hypothetical protein LQ350_008719 [Niorma chrysophthalma]